MSDTCLQPADGVWPDFHTPTRRLEGDDPGRIRPDVSGKPRFPLRPQPTRDDGSLSSTHGEDGGAGSVSGGWRGAPWGGHSDGGSLRSARGRGDRDGPCFALAVPPNGYAWWYIDGISDDGTQAVSVIAFIGSVFSPWYRWSGRENPENHVCINVATYGKGGRFTMTDRGASALRQTHESFTVGPSSLNWDGEKLFIDINEISSLPLVSRIRGQIVVTPTALTSVELPLTERGTHIWRPFAPTSRIDVDLGAGWQWSGHGYFDANFGTRALEQDFDYWAWGRYPMPDGSVCFYDAVRRDCTELAVGVKFTNSGEAEEFELPPKARVARSLWAVKRETRADPGFSPRQVKPMLDAPFYTRSVVETRIEGCVTQGVHEALDLNRFRGPWLMPMLAVRVPRRARWRF